MRRRAARQVLGTLGTLGGMLCAGWTTKVPTGADPLGLPWVRGTNTDYLLGDLP